MVFARKPRRIKQDVCFLCDQGELFQLPLVDYTGASLIRSRNVEPEPVFLSMSQNSAAPGPS